MEQDIWDFFCENIENYGFSIREGQQDMALDIGEAIRNKQHLMIEAGVGIGKSFAYIVPLLLFHKQFKLPLIIATSTITLQEQLFSDIKRISEIINYPIQIIVAKGQTHYICRKRLDELENSSLKNMFMEKLDSRCVERKDFVEDIYREQLESICVSNYGSANCRNCIYYRKCYFTVLRHEMRITDQIVVCNQDLLTVHLDKIRKYEQGLLPELTPIIIVDEAHNLEEKVRCFLTGRYSKNSIMGIVKDAANTANRYGTEIDKNISYLNKRLKEFFKTLNLQIEEQLKNSRNISDTGRFYFYSTNIIKCMIDDITVLLSELSDIIQIHSKERSWENQNNAIDDLERVAEDFREINNESSNIIWMEKNGESVEKIEICVCPHNIPERIRELYFNSSHVTILTSATLTNQKIGSCEEMYKYLKTSLDFPLESDSGYLAEPKPSPFAYDKQAMIYYTSDLPNPHKDREAFIIEGSKRIIELLKLSDGRALILFTSKNDMNAVYSYLLENDSSYKILKANNSASQEKILSEFRNEKKSVLLGTGAYWEGINVVGETLTNVIIFRLPFPAPDPITDSKCTVPGEALLKVYVPEMIIKLNQGIGRLIRSESDVGIISIIDPRLSDDSLATYKDIVWASIPIKRRTNDLSELNAFYKEVVHPVLE